MIRIFLSYRRTDAADITGRIYDHLCVRYGTASIFMDVDAISYGSDFRQVIENALRNTDVVVAIIGPRWHGPKTDQLGRIFDTGDPVRVEIETALAFGIPILPILVGGATMPSATQVPLTLQNLVFLNAAVTDSGTDFNYHVRRVTAQLDRMLTAAGNIVPLERDSRAPVSRMLFLAAMTSFLCACLALPYAGLWLHIAPPEPRHIAPITVGLEAGAICLSRLLFLNVTKERSFRRVWALASLSVALITVIYLSLLSYFTYETPNKQRLWAKGFICTEDAASVYKDKCPSLGEDELDNAGYMADRLWTLPSIVVVQTALAAVWLIGFALIGMILGTYLAWYRNAHSGFI